MGGSGKGPKKTTQSKPVSKDDHSYSSGRKPVISTPNMHSHWDNDSETEITPYTCSDCKRTVHTRDLPVECDFCENLFCFKCSKIESKETYKTFGSKDDGMLWFCNHCRVSFKGVKKMLFTVSKLEQKQEQLELKQDDMQEKQVEMKNRLDNLESSGIDEKTKEAISEQRERELRKLSFMCFGLPESELDTTEGRNNEDFQRIREITSYVMEIDEPDQIFNVKPVRIGERKPGRCRPLRLTIDSVESKKKVLEAARMKMKNSNDEMTRNVYFHPDLTRKQRQEAFERREAERLLKKAEEQKARELFEKQRRQRADGDGPGDDAEPFPGSSR